MMIRFNRFWKCSTILLFIILIFSSYSTVVYSYESGSIQDFDEELVSNIEFYCYSNSSLVQNEKALLMLKQVQQNELFSSINIDSGDLEENLNNYQETMDAEDENSNVISLDPKDTPWPMKCHDNHHTGRSPYSTADNNGAELWKFKTISWIECGPVLDSDGTLYFGDYYGYVYALNDDGSLKWRFDKGAFGTVTSAPTIGDDGTVYVGNWDKFLYAINPDGNLKWKFNAGYFASILGSCAVGSDGTIYFGTCDLTNDNKQVGIIFAVNPDGTEKWRYQTGYYISSSPAIADDGTIYIGSGDTYFYAINPDGSLKWRFKTGDYIKGPPSIADDGTVYFGSYDGYLYAIFPDGTLRWKCEIGYGTESNPSMGSDGTIYVGGEKLYAVNADGSLKWSFELNNNEIIFQSSPAVSGDGIVYVGTNRDLTRGDIIAVNPDGTLRWRRDIAHEWVDSSPCIGENGIVYIGSTFDDSGDDFGYLYAFGPGDLNNPPDNPSIDGQTNGKSGESYSYIIKGSDPDGDMISYFVDWGDGSDSGWQGPYSSGTSIELSHTWSEQGYYSIRAKVKDEHGSESSWSTLEVSMPRVKLLNLFFSRFFSTHPRLTLFARMVLE